MQCTVTVGSEFISLMRFLTLPINVFFLLAFILTLLSQSKSQNYCAKTTTSTLTAPVETKYRCCLITWGKDGKKRAQKAEEWQFVDSGKKEEYEKYVVLKNLEKHLIIGN